MFSWHNLGNFLTSRCLSSVTPHKPLSAHQRAHQRGDSKPPRRGAGRQQSRPDHQGAGPLRSGEGLEAELVTHGQRPPPPSLQNEASTKTQKMTVQRVSRLVRSQDIGVWGERCIQTECRSSEPLPIHFAQSILSHILLKHTGNPVKLTCSPEPVSNV